MYFNHLSVGQVDKKLDKLAQKTLQKIGKDSSIHTFAFDSIQVKIIRYSNHSKHLNFTKIESHFTQSGSLLLMYVYTKDKNIFLVETVEKASLKSNISRRKNCFYYNKEGSVSSRFRRINIQTQGIDSDAIHIDEKFLKAQGYNPTLNTNFLIQYIENLKKFMTKTI